MGTREKKKSDPSPRDTPVVADQAGILESARRVFLYNSLCLPIAFN